MSGRFQTRHAAVAGALACAAPALAACGDDEEETTATTSTTTTTGPTGPERIPL